MLRQAQHERLCQQHWADPLASLAGGMGSFSADAHELSRGFQDYLQAAVAATEVYAIRLAVMVSALPVFLLAGLVAVVDGLGQRDLRRFGGGREKGQVYHRKSCDKA